MIIVGVAFSLDTCICMLFWKIVAVMLARHRNDKVKVLHLYDHLDLFGQIPLTILPEKFQFIECSHI